jgi:hypothetical protein
LRSSGFSLQMANQTRRADISFVIESPNNGRQCSMQQHTTNSNIYHRNPPSKSFEAPAAYCLLSILTFSDFPFFSHRCQHCNLKCRVSRSFAIMARGIISSTFPRTKALRCPEEPFNDYPFHSCAWCGRDNNIYIYICVCVCAQRPVVRPSDLVGACAWCRKSSHVQSLLGPEPKRALSSTCVCSHSNTSHEAYPPQHVTRVHVAPAPRRASANAEPTPYQCHVTACHASIKSVPHPMPPTSIFSLLRTHTALQLEWLRSVVAGPLGRSTSGPEQRECACACVCECECACECEWLRLSTKSAETRTKSERILIYTWNDG